MLTTTTLNEPEKEMELRRWLLANQIQKSPATNKEYRVYIIR